MLLKHETCLQYFRRRLSEGWTCIKLEGHNAVLLSPEGIRRELDLRNDIETLRPNGAGTFTQLSIGGTIPAPTNWQSVDEAIADEDVTYVQSTLTDGALQDTYALPDSGVGAGTINGVTVYARVKVVAGSEPEADVLLRTHAAIYSASIALPGAYGTDSHEWVNNPNTTDPWTWDEIDALEAGIKFTDVYSRNTDLRCTQVYVEVDYTPAVGTNIQINIADDWKDVDSIQINIGDVWKDVVQVQQNIGDVWKTVFG